MQEKKTNRNGLAGPTNAINDTGGEAVIGGGSQESGIKGMLQRFEDDVKQSVFNVMYILLKDSDISSFKLSILLFIEFL